MEDAHAQMARALNRMHVVEREECGVGPGVQGGGGPGQRGAAAGRCGVCGAERTGAAAAVARPGALVKQVTYYVCTSKASNLLGALVKQVTYYALVQQLRWRIQVHHPGMLLSLLVLY